MGRGVDGSSAVSSVSAAVAACGWVLEASFTKTIAGNLGRLAVSKGLVFLRSQICSAYGTEVCGGEFLIIALGNFLGHEVEHFPFYHLFHSMLMHSRTALHRP